MIALAWPFVALVFVVLLYVAFERLRFVTNKDIEAEFQNEISSLRSRVHDLESHPAWDSSKHYEELKARIQKLELRGLRGQQ